MDRPQKHRLAIEIARRLESDGRDGDYYLSHETAEYLRSSLRGLLGNSELRVAVRSIVDLAAHMDRRLGAPAVARELLAIVATAAPALHAASIAASGALLSTPADRLHAFTATRTSNTAPAMFAPPSSSARGSSGYTPGSFCWTDLSTNDPEDSKRFYGGLFGWTFRDTSAGKLTYTLAQKDGRDVAALFRSPMRIDKRGVPGKWNCYVEVDSGEELAKTVPKLGGKVIAFPFDVVDAGRVTVIRDSAGAYVCAWQPKKIAGSVSAGEPGTPCWFELFTNNPGKSKLFYNALFKWSPKELASHTVFDLGDRRTAGMTPIDPKQPKVAPRWIPHFAVADCAAAVARARSLGANLIAEPKEAPNVGRFAILADSQAAQFALVEPALRTQ